MYHEIEQEMEQLLNSLHDIDCARKECQRQIESHIFFDDAIQGDVLNNYVLQLISLIPKTLKVKVDACMKLKTPYGMQMRWTLPGGMYFLVHLKDNLKVISSCISYQLRQQCSSPLSGHYIIPVLGLEWFDTFSYVQIMIPCILGTCLFFFFFDA